MVQFGVVFAACLCISSANAVTLFNNDINFLPSTPVPNTQPNSTTGTFDALVNSSASGQYRSPYEDVNQVIPLAYVGQFFNSVRNGTATYLSQLGSNYLSFLWGSPDSYNTLTFLDKDGNVLGSFAGSVLGNPQALGHHFVSFYSAIPFFTVIFASTNPAFEYAAMSFTPGEGVPGVPLPPAAILFGSALVGLTVLARRRRKLSMPV
jgi:hypothetical protein